MQDDDTRAEWDECDYIYYRLWLSDNRIGNPNGLRWLYDED